MADLSRKIKSGDLLKSLKIASKTELVFDSLGSYINAFGKDLPEKIWENVFCNLVEILYLDNEW
ncbi:hypothetical protein EAE91_04495 [Photorhabdus noenieputensis]|uniref:hypothetical protein n=1 Tax=Photorhabdus noenieputensis TaxID=1208607 RepID=UPI001BD550BE|nr:hypothetical protein [Photorhabdus noenieputensis]MBS9436455.1 hypothetical protein [Photorhabdus noenieputensis]MCK3668580.1 hypothetical protein [Photorhabdus noenieputensis]